MLRKTIDNFKPLLKKPIRNNHPALDTLLSQYEQIDGAPAKNISNLLRSTIQLFSDTNPSFIKAREHNPPEIICEKLNEMATAFKNFQEYQNNSGLTEKSEIELLDNAFQYCFESVKNRMGKLKKNDIYHRVYFNEENELKTLMESLSQAAIISPKKS